MSIHSHPTTFIDIDPDPQKFDLKSWTALQPSPAPDDALSFLYYDLNIIVGKTQKAGFTTEVIGTSTKYIPEHNSPIVAAFYEDHSTTASFKISIESLRTISNGQGIANSKYYKRYSKQVNMIDDGTREIPENQKSKDD